MPAWVMTSKKSDRYGRDFFIGHVKVAHIVKVGRTFLATVPQAGGLLTSEHESFSAAMVEMHRLLREPMPGDDWREPDVSA